MESLWISDSQTNVFWLWNPCWWLGKLFPNGCCQSVNEKLEVGTRVEQYSISREEKCWQTEWIKEKKGDVSTAARCWLKKREMNAELKLKKKKKKKEEKRKFYEEIRVVLKFVVLVKDYLKS